MTRNSASRANNSSPGISDASPPTAQRAFDRSGHDERRRGWFWHWNGVVTQYTPLIGLKGIGLLNSYTVWTDRREDSPHRGYAFPSQQSEANFYGEDRAELITINKILVALDLIEIRKEMVRKIDDQGRRWKVPQNLYRVKDRQDGIDLTAADVVRVIELADRDKAVYRYIRKLFSTKFEPIDRNNVWHTILKDVTNHPTWTKLAKRAAKQEARASERTKAGHRSRARQQESDTEDPGQDQMPGDTSPNIGPAKPANKEHDDASTILTSGHYKHSALANNEQAMLAQLPDRTTVDAPNSGSGPADEKSNNGSETDDAPANNGSSQTERGNVAESNNGRKSSVEQGSTMYYQSSSTTTTTTTSQPEYVNLAQAVEPDLDSRKEFHGSNDSRNPKTVPPSSTINKRERESANDRDFGFQAASPGGDPAQQSLAGTSGGGPMGDPSPLVLSLYAAANDRPATRLERILLSELETDANATAASVGSSGSEWVAAALREAVGSGSSFVAPKRIREIINRWRTAGAGPRGVSPETSTSRDGNHHPINATGLSGACAKHGLEESLEEHEESVVVRVSRSDAEQGGRLWDVVLDLMAADNMIDGFDRLRGVVPLGAQDDGTFVLGAPTRLATRLLDGKYRRLVEQALSSLLPGPVTVSVLSPDQWTIDS